jgi:hypothetical protein
MFAELWGMGGSLVLTIFYNEIIATSEKDFGSLIIIIVIKALASLRKKKLIQPGEKTAGIFVWDREVNNLWLSRERAVLMEKFFHCVRALEMAGELLCLRHSCASFLASTLNIYCRIKEMMHTQHTTYKILHIK